MQSHALSVTPKGSEFGECTEPQMLNVFKVKLTSNCKNWKGFFPEGEYGELS